MGDMFLVSTRTVTQNIFHFTVGGNCCHRKQRAPACWLYARTYRLECYAGNLGFGNDQLNCNRLRKRRRTRIKLVVIGRSFKIYFNNRLCARKTLKGFMVRQPRTKVYVSDPWYHAPHSYVWNMRYRKLRRAFRLSDFGLSVGKPKRGHHIGWLTTFANFVLQWTMVPKGRVGGYTSIVHFTSGGNCCGRSHRIPACWFSSNVLRLYCVASNPGNGNDGLHCSRWLHQNHRFRIRLTVNGKWFRIYVDNKLCSQKTLARNMVRSRARVYVSDPWHRPVNAWVWNMRYKQGSRGFRLSDFGLLKRIPRRGHHIGTLTTFSNFILEWYMTPLGKVSGWTSIVHFTRRSNCCHPYDRIPACFFHSRSYKLHCAANNPGSGNDALDCNRALAHRRRSHIQLKVVGRLFRIYVNRRLCSSKHLRRNPVRLSNTKVYVSDPWYRNTNSYVWNMRYRSTRSGFRVSNFGLERMYPIRGYHVGTLTTFANFVLEWDMIPRRKRGGLTNIVHFTARSNCCHRKDRIPACFFHSNTFRLHCV